MTRIHQDHFEIKSLHMEFKKIDEGFAGRATVVLRKESTEVTLVSSEDDFVEYTMVLQKVVDENGNYTLKPLKNLNQYWNDISHLADQDGQKVSAAAQELASERFKFSHNPGALLDEFLLQKKKKDDGKFIPLKEDYHRIFALSLLESKQALDARQKIIDSNPQSQKFFDGVDQIFIGLRPTGNAIQNYLYYKSFVNFDIDSLWKRLSNQMAIISDTFAEFMRRGTVPGRIAIPKLIDNYRRILELAKPVLNLLRISLELRNANANVEKDATLAKNIATLRFDKNYGSLFSSLDAVIRHSDAHVSIELENDKGLVRLLDARGKKAKLVRTYTYSDVSDLIREATQSLLPAVLIGFHLQEISMKNLVLASPEFTFRLLAVGNS